MVIRVIQNNHFILFLLSYFILFYFISFHLILFYFVLLYFTLFIVKIQSKVQISVLGLGVDFVLPLSQEQEQQEQQEQQEEPPPKSIIRGVLEVVNLTYTLLMGFCLSLRG